MADFGANEMLGVPVGGLVGGLLTANFGIASATSGGLLSGLYASIATAVGIANAPLGLVALGTVVGATAGLILADSILPFENDPSPA